MTLDVHLDDIYELVDVQTLRGQEVLNVYFYRTGALFVTTFPTNAQVLAQGWHDQILPTILLAQTNEVVHNSIRVRNLYDATDTFELIGSDAGASGNPTDSNFDAFAFQLQGETHAVRKGAKRLAGVDDDNNTDGVVTNPIMLGLLADVSDKMHVAVQVGLILPSDVFFPCLVKRERSGTTGAYTYALPHVRGEGVWTNIIGAVFDVLISSQVSRKIGRGA